MKREELERALSYRPHMIEMSAVRDNYEKRKPYDVRNGVAVFPIIGVLSNDLRIGDTSYRSVQEAMRRAQGDPEVREIVLIFDSPGGEADGVFETAQVIAEVARAKQVTAVVDATAYSAAYYLASQANEIWVPPSSGGVGSIGVWAMHVDISGFLANEGVKVTLVSEGKGKTDGNPFEPLSEPALETIKANVRRIYGEFVSSVARGRGIPESEIRRLGARMSMGGRQALGWGLADRIGTPEAAWAAITSRMQKKGVFAMPALPVHHTETSDGPWDGPANEARCPSERAPLRASHAWVDPEGDPETKAAYKFIHHEIAADGAVGAANLTACSTGIGVLNGARGGVDIPDSDREGVYNHLAAHLKDADQEAPPLESEKQARGPEAAGAGMEPGASIEAAAATDAVAEAAPEVASAPPAADARADALNYAAEVAELCALAGQPGKAAAFIRAGKPLADVRAELQKARAEEDACTQIHSHVLPETSADCGRRAETATNPNDSPLVKAAERLARAGKEK